MSSVAIYARVSTQEQNPENQLIELRDYVERRGLKIHKEYVDYISGAKDSRPALNDLMMGARKHLFDTVIFWKVDRLGRSVSHLTQIVKEWENLGIDFIVTSLGMDTSTPSGKLVFGIFAQVAEFEREIIRERINLGLARVRKEGKHIGRPKGKKDTKRRRTSGYHQRWSLER